jgi:hypothetical protein
MFWFSEVAVPIEERDRVATAAVKSASESSPAVKARRRACIVGETIGETVAVGGIGDSAGEMEEVSISDRTEDTDAWDKGCCGVRIRSGVKTGVPE